MAMTCIPFRFPGVPFVRCAFQTRQGGVSQGDYAGGNISFMVGDIAAHVTANRRALREGLGLALTVDLAQVHGDAVLFDPAPVPDDVAPTLEADGQATTQPGLGLIIKSADCQSILVAHTGGRHILALHAGWRGNRIDFPGTAVARFCDYYQLHPRDLMAVRGPSLGPTAAEFIHFDKEWSQDFTPWFNTHTRTMDLWALTRHQLYTAGLPHAHIFGIDMCTYSMHDMFFSYRRLKVSGRQGSCIWIGTQA